jgi:hypothetical protein
MDIEKSLPLREIQSHENPVWHSQQGMSKFGEKAPQLFVVFYSFSFSQQAEDRASIRIKLCNILNP